MFAAAGPPPIRLEPRSRPRRHARLRAPCAVEDVRPVIFKKRLLLSSERADPSASVDPPFGKQARANVGNDQKLFTTREADVTLIEQMIDVRRQEQAVVAVESFHVRGVSPRLDVTRAQVFRVTHVRHAAALFDEHHVGSEHSLAATGFHELVLEGRTEVPELMAAPGCDPSVGPNR